MHHKRGRPKNARAGCLLCHGYKQNGLSVAKRSSPGVLRRLQEDPTELALERDDDELCPRGVASEEFCDCLQCDDVCPHGHSRPARDHCDVCFSETTEECLSWLPPN